MNASFTERLVVATSARSAIMEEVPITEPLHQQGMNDEIQNALKICARMGEEWAIVKKTRGIRVFLANAEEVGLIVEVRGWSRAIVQL